MEFNTFAKILSILSLTLALTSCGSEDNDSRVTLSTSNVITVLNTLQYKMPFVVQVADLNGNPQANTSVTLSVKAISFKKGQHFFTDTDADATADTWTRTSTATCAAEDANNNGVLDVSEDTNGNNTIEPNIPTIATHPDLTPTLVGGTLTTDSDGFAYFSLAYPKSQGNWVTVELTATAEDGLAENTGKITTFLFILLSDIETETPAPAFHFSPYGQSASCSNAT